MTNPQPWQLKLKEILEQNKKDLIKVEPKLILIKKTTKSVTYFKTKKQDKEEDDHDLWAKRCLR